MGSETAYVLKKVLVNTKTGLIPPALDQVLVGNIERSKATK